MTTALVLIDLQNDYFPGGALELVGADAAVANAKKLLHAFREKHLPIFHIQHIAIQEGFTFFLPNTRGVEIHSAVAPIANEIVITKHFPNSFYETTLLNHLREIGASKLVFAGMMTQLCVDTTVRAAADFGFTSELAHDATATRDLQFDGKKVDAASIQLSFLAALDGVFAKVQSAQAIAAAL